MKSSVAIRDGDASAQFVSRDDLAKLMRKMKSACSFNREEHGANRIYFFGFYSATIYGCTEGGK